MLTRINPGYANANTGPDSISFNLTNLNTTTFNQLSPLTFTIASGGSTTIDLTAMTNTVYETFSLASVLSIMVLPKGGAVVMKPGATNGATWFLGGTTPTVTISDGGCLLFSEPVGGPGHAVDPTHKTLTFTNSGGTSLQLSLLIVGGT